MLEDWADSIADRIAGNGSAPKGRLLLLGAADTGKTTLARALALRLAQSGPVALVDADVGQSHIGPPSTVGWAVMDGKVEVGAAETPDRMPEFPAQGLAFVGDVTPVGHLLQLTAALLLCVEQAEQVCDTVLIDTPGLVTGGAACSLWWTVQRLLRPNRIIAIQRENELGELLGGLQAGLSIIETVETPAQLRRKSPEARQEHRRRLFERYFRDATAHTLGLKDLALRFTQRMAPDHVLGRLVGLTDGDGWDMAIGVIERWQPQKAKVTIRAPQCDIRRVQCLTIGDVRIETPFGWS